MNRQIQVISSTAVALLFVSQFTLADHRPNHGGGGGAGDDSGGDKKTQCKLEFAASFRDRGPNGLDGLRNDSTEPYVAIGGEGFRLDTNGSQKIETSRDSRFVRIDFSRGNPTACDPTSSLNAAGAAGFCDKLKGVDMRIEHVVQDKPGLCTMTPGDEVATTVLVNFESGPIDGESLTDPDYSGSGPVTLKLDYGCQALFVDYLDTSRQARLKAYADGVWTLTGESACLHTSEGTVLTEPPPEGSPDGTLGEPVWFTMPFELTIVSIDGP